MQRVGRVARHVGSGVPALDKIKDLIQPWDAPEIWPIRCKRLARYLGVRAPFRSGAQNVDFRCAFKEKGAGTYLIILSISQGPFQGW